MTVGIEVSKSFTDMESTVGAVQKLLEKPKIVGLLGPGADKELDNIKNKLPDITKNIDNFTIQVADTQAQLDQLANIDLSNASQRFLNQINDKKAKLNQQLGTLTVELNANKFNYEALTSQLNKIVSNAVGLGYSLVERMATAAQQQAAITISNSLLQVLSGPGISKAMGQLNVQEIDLQIKQNSIMTSLNNTMLRANALKERELAESGIKQLDEKAKKGPLTFEEENKRTQLQKTIAGMDITTAAMDAGKAPTVAQVKEMTPGAAVIAGGIGMANQGMLAASAAFEAKRRIETNNKELGTLKAQRDREAKNSTG